MKKWYVLQSKARKEFFLLEQLKLHNITTFLPCLYIKRVNPRARKIEPYFPGYLFIQTDLQRNASTTIQRMPGALSLVQFGSEFAALEDDYIQALQSNIEVLDGAHAKTMELQLKLNNGDRVTVKSGVFAGYEAIFDSHLSGSERVRLLLKWLEDRYVRVELPVRALLVG